MKNNLPAGSPERAGDWLKRARQFLAVDGAEAGQQPEIGGLETQLLLAHVLQKPRAWVLAHPEYPLTLEHQTQLDQMLAKLLNGTPLPYLIGHWEFFGLDFIVTPAVLIPRPETELLVERALGWLEQRQNSQVRAVDVGTGSGCIAVSLAKHAPGLRVLAIDRSWAALRIARQNAARSSAARSVDFLLADLTGALSADHPVDLLCANLPYIPHPALQSLPVAQHEPRQALDGGPDGLDLIRALLGDAPRWLAKDGLMLLEIQYDQGQAVAEIAQRLIPGARITLHQDMAGLDRLVEVENRTVQKQSC